MTITPERTYDANDTLHAHYHSHSAISWPSIIGGAVAAVAVSLALLVLGAGLGLVTTSPWQNFSDAAEEFTVKAAMWLIFMQWISSALGGYLTGRLRTKWRDVPSDEVFFRDSAHGFLTWALATALTAAVFTTAMTSIVSASAESSNTTVAMEVQNAPSAAAATEQAAASGVEEVRAMPEEAREDAAKLSTLIFLSFLVGAFAACLSAIYGGKHRDDY